jgi:TonB-dependent receptor
MGELTMTTMSLGAGVSRRLGWILPLILISSMVYAQAAKALITGSVADSSGAALEGASIQILPLTATATTNSTGEFSLPEVAAGHYTLKVSFVGFTTYSKEIDVTAGQTLNLPITLAVASQSQEILVTADRVHGEADAINTTRTADNIIQTLPSQVIMSLPNANVADALGRLPSIVLFRIEGEGVYIQVRGTEPRLTNITVDGITIPAPEPDVRQVRLDVIPSDLVESVQINKTLSANMDADGIGGSVNLITKTAAEHPTLNLFTDGGYTPIMNGRYAGDTGGTYGQRFGKSKKFGLLVNGSFDYNGRGIDNIQPGLDPLSTLAQPFYDNDTIRQYRYYRYRTGFDATADYKMNDNTNFSMTGIYTDLKDWGDKWYYDPVSKGLSCSSSAVDACAVGGGGTISAPSPTAASSSPKFYTSSKRPDASVGSLILSGRHFDNNSWITATLSASRSYEVDSAGNPKADFSWIGPTVYCNYNPASQFDKYRPTFETCDQAGSVLQTAADWIFKDITISKGLVAELDLTGALSYAHTYTAGGHFGTYEVGFKFSNNHKSQDSTENVYDGWSTKSTSTVDTMAQLQSGFENTDYYNGSYFGGKFGPVSDFNKVAAYTLASLASYLDPYKTALDNSPNIFHYVEQIPAWYAMNTIELGRFHLQTGLRFEDTRMSNYGSYLNIDPNPTTPGTTQGTPIGPCTTSSQQNCYTVSSSTNTPSYLDVLPSLQLRYRLDNDSDVRLVVARGVARPDPYQLVPYITEDDSSNPPSLAVGNPTIRPEHANNYDLLYEKYLQPLGMIQGGFFFKQLTAPQQELMTTVGVNFASLPAGAISLPAAEQTEIEQLQAIGYVDQGAYPTITVFVNGQNAYLYGFELSFQQHLNYLPSVLGGLGISANYAYTNSQEKGLPLRTDSPRLLDQAANDWNISPTYDTKRFSLRMGMSFNGANLETYNWIANSIVPGADLSGLGPTGPSGDTWTLPHLQVDAQATYRAWRGLSVMANGLNLNNEVFGYYTGSTQFVNQREYYKPTYTIGLHYTFNGER